MKAELARIIDSRNKKKNASPLNKHARTRRGPRPDSSGKRENTANRVKPMTVAQMEKIYRVIIVKCRKSPNPFWRAMGDSAGFLIAYNCGLISHGAFRMSTLSTMLPAIAEFVPALKQLAARPAKVGSEPAKDTRLLVQPKRKKAPK